MIIRLSDARNTLGRLIDDCAAKNREMVIVKHGAPVAVLMSYGAYESLRETAIVTADGPLMRDIRKGLRELKSRKARTYTLDELFS